MATSGAKLRRFHDEQRAWWEREVRDRDDAGRPPGSAGRGRPTASSGPSTSTCVSGCVLMTVQAQLTKLAYSVERPDLVLRLLAGLGGVAETDGGRRPLAGEPGQLTVAEFVRRHGYHGPERGQPHQPLVAGGCRARRAAGGRPRRRAPTPSDRERGRRPPAPPARQAIAELRRRSCRRGKRPEARVVLQGRGARRAGQRARQGQLPHGHRRRSGGDPGPRRRLRRRRAARRRRRRLLLHHRGAAGRPPRQRPRGRRPPAPPARRAPGQGAPDHLHRDARTGRGVGRIGRAGDGDDEVRGSSGAAGVVQGRARVVLDPATAEPLDDGEMLVCRFTDPSWTPLFLLASALVIDIGASASHGAIVARELGIPCVIGTGDGTRRIATGDLLAVDGSTGVGDDQRAGRGAPREPSDDAPRPRRAVPRAGVPRRPLAGEPVLHPLGHRRRGTGSWSTSSASRPSAGRRPRPSCRSAGRLGSATLRRPFLPDAGVAEVTMTPVEPWREWRLQVDFDGTVGRGPLGFVFTEPGGADEGVGRPAPSAATSPPPTSARACATWSRPSTPTRRARR